MRLTSLTRAEKIHFNAYPEIWEKAADAGLREVVAPLAKMIKRD